MDWQGGAISGLGSTVVAQGGTLTIEGRAEVPELLPPVDRRDRLVVRGRQHQPLQRRHHRQPAGRDFQFDGDAQVTGGQNGSFNQLGELEEVRHDRDLDFRRGLDHEGSGSILVNSGSLTLASLTNGGSISSRRRPS